jgi:CHAT domain-containing protein/tetratricopeptide (TPR) repeat protein
MARKWIRFFRSMESLLKEIWLKVINRTFWQKRYLYLMSLLFVGVLLAIAIPVFSQTPPSAPTGQTSDNVEQQVDIARQAYQEGRYLDAIQTLQTVIELLAPVDKPQLADQPRLATTLTNLGLAQLALGRAEDALDSWQRSETIYKLLGNNNGEARSLIYQAQAFQELGAYTRSCDVALNALIKLGELKAPVQICNDLTEVMLHAAISTENLPDDSGSSQLGITKIIGWYQLGDALRTIGKLDESILILRNLSIPILKEEADEEVPAPFNHLSSLTKASIHLSLGNTRRAIATLKRDRQDISPRQDIVPWRCEDSAVLSDPSTPYLSLTDILNTYDQAISSYGYAITTPDTINTSDNPANQKVIKVQAQLNYLNLLIEAKLVAAYKEHPSQKQSILETGQPSDFRLNPEYVQAVGRAREYDRIVQELEGRTDSHEENTLAFNLLSEIQLSLNALSESRAAVYAHINFAKSLSCLEHKDIHINISPLEQLEKASQIVQATEQKDFDNPRTTLSNLRSKSYTLGSFGSFYEYKEDLAKASQFTEEALLASQAIEAPDITYQWQWQTGRLLRKQNNINATQAFERSVQTLESVRENLLTVSSDIQFSFRDNVEPLYRGLINLLLTPVSGSDQPLKENLEKVPALFSGLQLAELKNFFQCEPELLNATESTPDQNEENYKRTAFIYAIFLEHRLAVVTAIPSKSILKYHAISYEEAFDHSRWNNIQEYLRNFRQLVSSNENNEPKLKGSSGPLETVYDWLIRPSESEHENILELNEIDTLIFVLDTNLRNLPMSALIDKNNKQQFLVDKYATALAPGLRLFNPERTKRSLNVLAGGVSGQSDGRGGYTDQEIEGKRFGTIDVEEKEFKEIGEHVNVRAILLNEEFTKQNIADRLQSTNFSAIHFKTHGEFNSDPAQTFLVAYQELIRAKEVADLIASRRNSNSEPLELLVLGACHTADGDNRAILGIAGVGIRAGARTTISTLWKSYDKTSERIMLSFYKNLRSSDSMTKAKALQQALIEAKGNDVIHEWASFILVGNWL